MEEFLSKCLEFLASAEGSAATIAVVLDFALRMMPSKKPLGVVHMVAKMIGMVGKVLVKVSEISDKVLPQKVKED